MRQNAAPLTSTAASVGLGAYLKTYLTLLSTILACALGGCGDDPVDLGKTEGSPAVEEAEEEEERKKRLKDAVDLRDLVWRDDVIRTKFSDAPFTGWVKQGLGQHGEREVGQIISGQQEGHWTQWHENGHKDQETTYKDGRRDGKWEAWYENGQKMMEGHYKDGYHDGLETSWHENGQKSRAGSYNDQKKIGIWMSWHDNGQKMESGSYEDGREDGLWTYWRENGQKGGEVIWKNGDQVSVISFAE